MIKNIGYKFRIYPNDVATIEVSHGNRVKIIQENQIEFLAKNFGCCRWIYNYSLSLKKDTYAEFGRSATRNELSELLPVLKKESDTIWLKDSLSQPLQNSIKNLEEAYINFFENGSGYPKFKKKHDRQSFTMSQGFEILDGKLHIPKLETGIKIVQHIDIIGKPTACTISMSSTGKYYVSITCSQEIEIVKKPIVKSRSMGYDLGINPFVTMSNSVKIFAPKLTKKYEVRLSKANRSLARKKLGSCNWKKQKRKLAIIHEKIKNGRLDFTHKTSYRIVNENQVDTFCLEDLDIQKMLQYKEHKNLPKNLSDVSLSELVRQIKYKAEWMGKNILQIDRFDASTKKCNICKYVNNDLRLEDKEWTCVCGAVHDRDINASTNIKDIAFLRYDENCSTENTKKHKKVKRNKNRVASPRIYASAGELVNQEPTKQGNLVMEEATPFMAG